MSDNYNGDDYEDYEDGGYGYGFYGDWYFKFFRVILLLCAIIPISMRINLDLGKIYYSYCIQTDSKIPGCIVRNSTIPEELGRL